MKESEAKTKWCPLVRADAGIAGEAINRVMIYGEDGLADASAPGFCCLGSKCMAWTWSYPSSPFREDGDGYCGAFPGKAVSSVI